MGPANLLTQWSRLLVRSLVDAGLTDLVVSPGSRSTPLVLAAHAEPKLNLHIVRDERAAAFFALGRVRATGKICGLVCTSGSAAGHYLPAVMEAKADGLPLLVLTADRPFELADMAAPQTVDQTRLFGDHAVGFVELGTPDPHPEALRGLRRRAAQALSCAVHPRAGAVQVNVRARKPLHPVAEVGEAERELAGAVDAVLQRPVPRRFVPRSAPNPDGVRALAEALQRASRPLFVAGPAGLGEAGGEALVRLAQKLGAPVIAEAASQLRFGGPVAGSVMSSSDLVLRHSSSVARLAPDLVVQVGRPPTGAPLLRALMSWTEAQRWIVAPSGWPDGDNRAEGLVLGAAPEVLDALRSAVAERDAHAYLEQWSVADARARKVLDGTQVAAAEGRTVEPPRTPAAEVRAVEPPRTPAAEGRTVEPPRTPAAEGRAVEPPRRPVAEGRAVEPKRTPAAEGRTVEPPRTPAAEGRAVEPPRRPVAEGRAVEPKRVAAAEGRAARAVVEATPAGSLLILGNSLPIRHVETYVPAAPLGLDVLVQRGINGIDGLVAGAIGAAEAAGRPATLLLGDVSLGHDASSLELGADATVSVVVVALDNGGGRIFEILPAHDRAEGAQTLFTTPHRIDFEALARAYGVRYARAEDGEGVSAAVQAGHRQPGLTLVHVVLPPHGAREDLDALTAALEEVMP